MEYIKKAVAKYADLMTTAEQYMWENPEVGFKEFKTNAYMINEFEKLGYKLERFDGITGFTTYYDTGKEGPTVLVLAELDSLYCNLHPECDKQTGACHVCGHNEQCAAILGVAGAIKDAEVNGELCGKVKFGIVPAEEGIEVAYRAGLVEKGVITFTSGKPECIYRGLLNDVDVAFMIHIGNSEIAIGNDKTKYFFKGDCNGVIRKQTIISGKSAHAGGCPWDGVNALYAAEMVFSATNALRETFHDDDYIRFHSIITKGGDSVNTIPEEVIIESYVRGGNTQALKDANRRINRAIVGACLSLGATVKIKDNAGSEPLKTSDKLRDLMLATGSKLVGEDACVYTGKFEPSSTDMGDVSCLVPAVHGYVDGQRGDCHGKNYTRLDPTETCVNSAQLQLATVCELLKDGGKKAYEIVKDFKPVYPSIDEYIAQKKQITRIIDGIEYDGDGAKISF